jgi:uncharacterized protein (TIGR02246 family)
MTAANAIREAIVAANGNFMETFKGGEAARMAALYTENGQLLPPNSDFVTGRQAIQGFWQALFDMGIQEVSLESVEVDGHGETAIEVGKYALKGEGGQELDAGKYIVIWKREDGQWKLHRDIFNSSMPAAQ